MKAHLDKKGYPSCPFFGWKYPKWWPHYWLWFGQKYSGVECPDCGDERTANYKTEGGFKLYRCMKCLFGFKVPKE